MNNRRRFARRARSSSKGRLMGSGWYIKTDINGTFYTPFTGSKRTWTYAGDGVKDATPKELADFMNERTSRWVHESTKIVQEVLKDEASMLEVELPHGVYIYRDGDNSRPERLVQFDLRNDEAIDLGETFAKVQEDIANFLNNEKVYTDHGLIYKLGILLYGPPGNGKTVLVRQILRHLPNDSVVIFLEKDLPSDEFLLKIRESLDERLKVFIFEELAVDLSNYFVGKLLTFLDGEFSINRSIALATTNYPEKLPGNLVDRPSRFDKLYKFDHPKAEGRKLLFKHFLNRDITDAELSASTDLSIAAIKEASLLVLVNKITLVEAIKMLKNRTLLCSKAFAQPVATLGFKSNSWEDD